MSKDESNEQQSQSAFGELKYVSSFRFPNFIYKKFNTNDYC